MKEYDFNYLIKKERFIVAFHPLSGWLRGGWLLKSWIFSFRIKSGYSNRVKKFGQWWQLCILGLNIGYIYKLDN